MMRTRELIATACEKRAGSTTDPCLASALRQRARQLRDMALEIDLLERDPSYRTIHDRPNQIVDR
jgi:hypothetical protein